jgi:tetratricopeptide (TPR) repeat protein
MLRPGYDPDGFELPELCSRRRPPSTRTMGRRSLAASQTFGAHMGWADMATVVPIAERAAQAAIRADSEDPRAHHALGSVYLFTRRFEDSLSDNPNFSLAQGYYGLTLAYCGRWQEADLAVGRTLRLSPRDPFAAIYCGIAAYAQFVGRNYDEAMRLAPGAAQHLARLDRERNAHQTGRRPRALFGGLPPCRPEVAASLIPGRRSETEANSVLRDAHFVRSSA